MRYKPDWPEAKKRLSAMWHGEQLDRPCVSIQAPRPTTDTLPVPTPANAEAYWLDPAFIVPRALNTLNDRWWGGESLPGILLMANWVNCLGGTPRFDRQTIWFDTQKIDFSLPSPFRHDPENQWTAKYKTLLLEMCKAAGRDDFCVGFGAGLPVNDLLSMTMGAENFLLALLEQPEWLEKAIIEGARDQLALYKELHAMVRGTGHALRGMTGWMPFWAPEPFCTFQSDVSCMLSPEMFGRFVMPEMEMYAEAIGPIWYHLDGGDARQHLPRLLSLPFLRVLQYTPAPCEPDNGPAHLEMYKTVQKAGKILHISVPLQNIEPLVKTLNPSLLMLDTHCSSRDEGERILEEMVKWSEPHSARHG